MAAFIPSTWTASAISKPADAGVGEGRHSHLPDSEFRHPGEQASPALQQTDPKELVQQTGRSTSHFAWWNQEPHCEWFLPSQQSPAELPDQGEHTQEGGGGEGWLPCGAATSSKRAMSSVTMKRGSGINLIFFFFL